MIFPTIAITCAVLLVVLIVLQAVQIGRNNFAAKWKKQSDDWRELFDKMEKNRDEYKQLYEQYKAMYEKVIRLYNLNEE